MRFLIALLAVLGLVFHPVTAAAARAGCNMERAAAMASMEHPGVGTSTADPGCDHAGKIGKMTKSCAAACAAACSVSVAIGQASGGVAIIATKADVFAALALPSPSHQSAGFDPPPR